MSFGRWFLSLTLGAFAAINSGIRFHSEQLLLGARREAVGQSGDGQSRRAPVMGAVLANYPGGDNACLSEVANELLPEAQEAAKAERARQWMILCRTEASPHTIILNKIINPHGEYSR